MLVSNVYASKLLKSFDLILNQTVDNRDDTIILKLVDQLSRMLMDTQLYDSVLAYVLSKILNDQFNLIEKDPEQQLFCLNLLKCVISIKYNQKLESSTQDLILKLLNDDFFLLDSAILCSLIDLVGQMHELSNQIRDKLFSLESIGHFLDPEIKSVYVRKNFKLLLVKYLHEPALIRLVQSLPESTKLHNLDIFHSSGLIVKSSF